MLQISREYCMVTGVSETNGHDDRIEIAFAFSLGFFETSCSEMKIYMRIDISEGNANFV